MKPLDSRQKQLIFDYCIGIATDDQIKEAQSLISSNKHAQDLYDILTAAISPLDMLENETCPDNLVEATIQRLTDSAASSHIRLRQLIAQQQTHTINAKGARFRKIADLVSVAAIILFVAGVYFAPLRNMREKSWQTACASQMRRISQGIQTYSSEHDGRVPSVATAAGAPWWKVGYQGEENHSNTRHMWLLAKNGYVDPTDFVCPGKRQGRAVKFDPAKAAEYNDFPARRYVTYSFRVMCDKPITLEVFGPKVLMSDLNPHFDMSIKNYSGSFTVKLKTSDSNRNSPNHNRRGQNVLFGDGHVDFKTRRCLGKSDDDIFTLQGTLVYKGSEIPKYDTDAFLAP